MAPPERALPHRQPRPLGGVAGAGLLLLAVLYAHRVGRTPDDILGFLAGPIGEAQRLSAAFESAAGELLAGLRLPLAVGIAAWLLLGIARGRRPGRGGGLIAVIGVAAAGQSLLLDGYFAAALALYALAATVHGLSRFEVAPDTPLAPKIEIPLTLALLALYTGLALYRLDLYPAAFADEAAYHEAARMLLGHLPTADTTIFRWQDYSFERFRAQLAPLALHAAATFLSPGLLSLRLVSVAAIGGALLLAATSLRRRVGPRAALWTLALAGVVPQLLTYARLGFYLSLSILHSVLCFWAVLRLLERREWKSALALGLLVGSSACFYQLSWFVPILVGTTLIVAWALAEARPDPRVLALAGLSAALLLLTSVLLLRTGFRAVADQTFDRRAVWTDEQWVGRPTALVRIRQGLDAEALAAVQDRIALPLLRARPVEHGPYTTTLLLQGPVFTLQKALPRFEAESWRVLRHGLDAKSLRRNLSQMFAIALYVPSRELSRWIPPLIPAPLAPLVFVGLLEAVRRRREPALQAVLVWVIVGGLLPGALGSAPARRAALMWPFVATLAALPLVQLGRALSARGRWGTALGASLATLVYLAAVGHGIGGYFERSPRRSALGLAKLLTTLPSDQAVLLTPNLIQHTHLLEEITGRPRPAGLKGVASAGTRAEILAISCRERPPFAWITADEPGQRRRFDVLRGRFAVRSERREGFRLFRVEDVRPGACASIDAPVP